MVATLSGEPARYAGGLHEVAPRVWAWLQPNGSWGESNAGLVAGDGASLLIDTLWDERLTQRMLNAMETHTSPAPIETVVNTHSDGDHWWGNALVPPGAEIITTAASLEAMASERPAELLRFRRLSSLAVHIPGTVRTFGGYVEKMLGPYRFEGVHPRLPDRSFQGQAEVKVGGRTIRLLEVGPAHTAGDSVVHVPDAGVVFAADVLFVGSTPVMWAGPTGNWVRALDSLDRLDADVYVPGHGPLASVGDIALVREYWEWLDAAARASHTAGQTAVEAAWTIARSVDFARSPWRNWDAPERLMISVATIYRGLEGAGGVPTTLEVVKLFNRVATLGRELDRE